jgi:hypothetical protein
MATELDTAIATIRTYGEAVEAERVVALLDTGDEENPTMIEWTPEATLVTEQGIELDATGAVGEALELPHLRPVPSSALTVDVAAEEIGAPIGAIRHLVEGVRGLASALGGQSVAVVDFATRDPEVVMTLAAREGEPVVVAVGDATFQLPGD